MAASLLAVVLVAGSCSGDDDSGSADADDPCGAVGGLDPRGSDPGTDAPSGDEPDAGDDTIDVLLFTRTAEFRHDSIGAALDWFATLGPDTGVAVTATDETDLFTDDGLESFDVVAFVNTTGDVLSDDEQQAFRAWLEGGGGFVGVHAAADTEHSWPWYGDMLGASFTSHPLGLQNVRVTNERPDDPTVSHLPATFSYAEEWYNFDRNPRDTSDVLLSIDEATATFVPDGTPVTGFTQGADHPAAWSRQVENGRVWYTALGHLPSTWQDEAFRSHVLEGIRWAADPARYRRSLITDDVDAAVALDVAPSGLVLWAERGGDVEVWDPSTGGIHTAGTVPTRLEGEGGLMGLRLAPDAAATGHVYTYATAPGDGDVGTNTLVRHTLTAECTLEPGSAETLLEVPNEFIGHQAGDIEFLPDGTLLVSTGDNTRSTEGGMAPLGGTGIPPTDDARRSAGNPNDLRGKILRIGPDGSIPAGNLYPPDGSAGRPEVFATGMRNPYRVAVDGATGRIWWGDIGPDALLPDERGPQGLDELNTAVSPGDYGWPYCIGAGLPYRTYDAGTGVVGDPYDCAGRQSSVLAYDYGMSEWLALGSAGHYERYGSEGEFRGRSLMAGAWYGSIDDADAALPLGEVLLLHDFSRNHLLAASTDGNGRVTAMNRVAPWAGVTRPIDVRVGPDGALFILEYEDSGATASQGPGLTRLEFSASGVFPDLPDSARSDGTDGDGQGGQTGGPQEAGGPIDGQVVFRENCSGCHGSDGEGGTGPELRGVAERLSRDDLLAVVREGRGVMPAWEGELTDEQITAVADYLLALDSG